MIRAFNSVPLMILCIGLDLCDAQRFKRALARRGFVRRVFTEGEIAQCSRRRYRHLHLAARFAAKEAYMKAIGTGWGEGVGWHDVVVDSDGASPPSMKITGGAGRHSRALGVRQVHVSMTHSGGYAAAMIVLEGVRRHAKR